MIKTVKKRLRLNRQTIRRLNVEQLEAIAAGGNTTRNTLQFSCDGPQCTSFPPTPTGMTCIACSNACN